MSGRPGGERTTLGGVTFDTTFSGGCGHGFEQVGDGHYRFRARHGREPYAWRFCLRIESPGRGRKVVVEVADFNHFGGQPWQETAAVVSDDGLAWRDLDPSWLELVPWTPTGDEAADASFDDGWHPPYGVRYRLTLDHSPLWLASPTPYPLERCRDQLDALAARYHYFAVEEIGRTAHGDLHGHPLRMIRFERPSAETGRIRVLVLAGEHPAESAGLYACEGLLDELLRLGDFLTEFSFWVVPVVNVDGLALGRTYHNLDPADSAAPGTNLARDWRERTQPETRAVWQVIEAVRPHCLVTLHNGRHRREFEVVAPPQPHLATLMSALREQLPVPLANWRLTDEPMAHVAAMEAGLAECGLCLESLLLRKMPGCEDWAESYRRAGRFILRGLTDGLRDVYGKPRLWARSEVLGAAPLRCAAADFTGQLPSFYYGAFAPPRPHAVHSFEVNGLPLVAGHYDACLHLPPDRVLRLRDGDGSVTDRRAVDGWVRLPSRPIPARKLSFEYEAEPGAEPPFDEVLICPEGQPLDTAVAGARRYDRYVRRTRAESRAHLTDWEPFGARLMRDDFGPGDLVAMRDELIDWFAGRQVMDPDDHHYGAVWSEEDKYDARDTAAAAACFAGRHAATGVREWLDRAVAARSYVYRNQMHEPGNAARDGGFVHMVSGSWALDFTRLEPPYPYIDGVDTGIICHQLCRAADLGLPLGGEDVARLRQAGEWLAVNEFLPGVFRHHEGSTVDCQNANAIGLATLARVHHTLAAAGGRPPEAWLEAAARGLRHYAEGQEAIGVWPYHFASVGRRGQAYDVHNLPDQGMGLVHFTRACHLPPLADWPGLSDLLRRAARWYLGMGRLDGGTIDLDHDRRPDLGGDICFSGFTWCRFTAAAVLLRIARVTGEVEPWRHLALRLMEHVRRKLWQRDEPSRAPVVAHARPEAVLGTWCQTAEWDASMLDEMVEDLAGL